MTKSLNGRLFPCFARKEECRWRRPIVSTYGPFHWRTPSLQSWRMKQLEVAAS